ncbi:hypothetical protein [Melioribacter sp. OK-6-Me]|uniref:hypothetical protein n=1 Tax=unclassified Melioribacter TaxID=2627329 RepID=UPI003ED8EA80
MKISEEILRYYSDLMTEEEKKLLEKKISDLPSMKEEFDKAGKLIERLRDCSNIEVDESYFINLLPRVRERLNIRKGRVVFEKIAYALSISVFVAFTLIISFLNAPLNTEMNYSLEQEEIIRNLVTDYLTVDNFTDDYTIDIQTVDVEDNQLVDYLLSDDNLITELYIDTDLLLNEQ